MRAIGVEVRHKKQTGCPGQFAYIVLDFEPAETYTFVNALAPGAMEYPDSQARFVPVVDDTAHDHLENQFGAGPLPVRVTLRAARDHPTDSNDASFRIATVRAVRLAFDRTGRAWTSIAETFDDLDSSERVAYVRSRLDDPRHVFQALDLCTELFPEPWRAAESPPPRDTADLLRPLADLAASPDDRVALRAVRVLARAPHRRAHDLIAGALARPVGAARDLAVRTLARRGDARAAEPLAEILARDRLPKDIEWPVHAMKDHASVLLPPIRARLDAAEPGALEPFLFELACQVSRWGGTAAPLAPSLRRLVADDGTWTSGELSRALARIVSPDHASDGW
ncbi:HEAT repeat domain-containing protein [Spirillospora sp. NPDC052242]